MMCLSTFLLQLISQLCFRLKDLVEILRLDLDAVSANGLIRVHSRGIIFSEIYISDRTCTANFIFLVRSIPLGLSIIYV